MLSFRLGSLGLVVPAVLLGSALGACNGDSGGSGGEATGKTGLELSFAFTTPAGEETHWCQYTRLPSGVDAGSAGRGVSVKGYTWTWSNMHHWALYRTLPTLPADVELDKPFDCFAPGGMKHAAAGSLVLAGMAGGEQKFPEGTGFAFKPDEIVIVQAHTLNVTGGPIEAKLDVALDTVDPGEVPNPLGLIQFYDPYISVPALTDTEAHMRCRIPQDMTVLFGTTHQHERGAGVEVYLDPPGGSPRAESPFLVSTDWEHPRTVEAPMQLQKDAYVRTRCSYRGDEHDVFQGQTKEDDEMCMFIAYYYPALEGDAAGLFENCVQDSIPGGVGDEYGVGNQSCAASLACIQACPPGEQPNPVDGRIDVGRCWQQCLVDSCPTATAPLNDLGSCVSTKCAAECADAATCGPCVISNCGTEYSACQAATCPG